MAEDVEDDIGADIRSAIQGLSEGGGQVEPVATIPEPAAPGEEAPDLGAQPVEPPADTRARDETGKFVKASDKLEEQGQPVEVAQTPQEQDTLVPRSLSPEAKAEFLTWPPLAQAEFRRREGDTAKGVDKLQQELRTTQERYQPLEAIIAPHRERWQLQGMGEAQALQTLFAAQELLERDAPRAIDYLARSYGVNLGQLTAAPGTPAPQADPQVQALTQQVQTLSQRLEQQAQVSQSQREAEARSNLDAFASDPKHIYFNDVRADMAVFIQEGRAKTLDEAYQMATWASPRIRPLMQAEQQRQQAAEQAERQRQQAATARQAGGSIAGSAGPGSMSAGDVDPNASIEDDVRRAFAMAQGRV